MPVTPPTVSRQPVKVSVVVPTHDTGETVLTGLHSFLAQTMPRTDFEVIYVDDGSTDDTVAILESEVARQEAESTVRVIRTTNSGWPGRPRNIGMDAARGEFVHFVDDDDRLAPEALERTYARAQETRADIVIGRMAGHGRRAPKALFEKPIAAADLRTDTSLLGSMTVHKLFRRSFLQEHGLRFEEGPVRLEDHMFTLRAYLLTGRVATVHDYTCYHWVRHRGEDHNISYEAIEPGPYLDSVRKVLAILDAPDTYVAPGRHRNRLIAKWYGNKALARISGDLFLRHPARLRAEWFKAVSDLAADLPPEADSSLPTRLRIVSALARRGESRLLEEHAEFEAGVGHQPAVRSTRWRDGRLTVRCGTRLVRKEDDGGPALPLPFSRARGRYRLQLSPGVAAVPEAAEAADFTKAVQRSNVKGLLRHREGGTTLSVPLDYRVVEKPLRDESAATASVAKAAGSAAKAARRLRLPGRLTDRLADWLTTRLTGDPEGGPTRDPARRLPGGSPEQDLYALEFETEFTVDPASADNGRPLAPGTWDLQLQLGCGGWRTARRLRGCTIDVPAEGQAQSQPAWRRAAAPVLRTATAGR